MAELLDNEEIEDKAPDGWGRDGDEIVRLYEFDEYLDGVDFAAQVGELAEEEFHHPEIIINYGEVEVRFTNHEAGGVTDQDIRLAGLVNDEY